MFRKLRYRVFIRYRKRIDAYQDILYTLYKKYKENPTDNSQGFNNTFLYHGGMCGNLTNELIKQTVGEVSSAYSYSSKCLKSRRKFFKTIGFRQTDFILFIKKYLPECQTYLSEPNSSFPGYGSYWTWRFPVTGPQEQLFHPSDFIKMRKEYIKFLLNRLCDRHGI